MKLGDATQGKGTWQNRLQGKSKGKVHNNKMERMNGELKRQRKRVMRGPKTTDTAILEGYRIFRNFVRPHEDLNGKTPADLAGIKVIGENKWLTLIQNARHPTESNGPVEESNQSER